MSTTTIDRADLLKELIASSQAELAKLESAEEMATRERIRKQHLVGPEQGVKHAQELADKFPALIDSAYADLKASVAERFSQWRGRYHLAESNVGVHRCINHLTTLLNGQCEQLLSLEQVKVKFEEAQRIEATITKKD